MLMAEFVSLLCSSRLALSIELFLSLGGGLLLWGNIVGTAPGIRRLRVAFLSVYCAGHNSNFNLLESS